MQPSTAIREARSKAAISQKELAVKSGITERTVSNIENDRTKPNGATLTALARAMGYLTYEELLQAVGSKSFSAQPTPAGLVPVLGSVQAGFEWDGDHSQEGHDNGVGTRYIQRDLIAGLEDPEAFAVVIAGDSMMPELAPGEVAICSPGAAREKIISHRTYAIRMGANRDHEATIKQIQFEEGDEEVVLKPTNPRHPTRSVAWTDIDRMAEVVATIRRYSVNAD